MKKNRDIVSEIKKAATGIRCRVLDYTIKNSGGYLSQACSSAEILASLYLGIMKLAPAGSPMLPGRFTGVPGKGSKGGDPGYLFNGIHGPEYDRFFLSPTHYSLVLYAALVEARRMDPRGLEMFNIDGMSVEMIGAEHSPGMEVMTGSLGQGISQAGGIALARKRRGEPGMNWIFMSDGELQPGQVWEALQAISFYRLDNVGIYIDVNGYQCDGRTSAVMAIEPLEKRLESFGCRVLRLDGHDIGALLRAPETAHEGAPLAVVCDTDPCRGIDLLKRRIPKLHYFRFIDEKERGLYTEYLTSMQKGL